MFFVFLFPTVARKRQRPNGCETETSEKDALPLLAVVAVAVGCVWSGAGPSVLPLSYPSPMARFLSLAPLSLDLALSLARAPALDLIRAGLDISPLALSIDLSLAPSLERSPRTALLFLPTA